MKELIGKYVRTISSDRGSFGSARVLAVHGQMLKLRRQSGPDAWVHVDQFAEIAEYEPERRPSFWLRVWRR